MAQPSQNFVVVVTQPGTPLRMVFAAEGIATLGRDTTNTVLLAHPMVSRHHARVVRVDAATFRVEDLGSRNGTVANGARVAGAALAAAPATLEIGPFVVSVSPSAAEETWTVGLPSFEYGLRTLLDRGPRQLHVDGALVLQTLSPNEFALLDVLAAAAPAVVDRVSVGNAIWGDGQWDTYMLHNLVSRIRKRLAERGASDDVIVTVPGVGYRME